jgi:hypothetical protein
MPISLTSTISIISFIRLVRSSRSSGKKDICLGLCCLSMLINSRDPWWVFTTLSLFYTIKREYNFGLWELVFISPRFGVMLASMCLSIAFIVVDTCSVLNAFSDALPQGIEPFWKVRIHIHFSKIPRFHPPFSILRSAFTPPRPILIPLST